jgi:DNA-binding NarL/FixJ family response regulator
MPPLRVLLADDHALVRAGLRSLLEEVSQVEVIAEAADGLQALELIGQHRPHLALLDIGMSGMNGLDVAERVAREFPEVRVVMLSMHANEEYVRRALRAGARGYVPKDVDPSELRRAIEAVQRGEFYLSPSVSRQVAAAVVHGEEKPGLLERLTPRQREVLQLVAEGFKSKEIARKLKIGVRTVETYRAQLMEQLGVRDVVGLVHFAIRVGLVEPKG